MKEKKEQDQMEFFASIFETAKEIAGEIASRPQQEPSSLCIDQSRTINNVRVNVVVSSPKSPGILRRLFAKLF